MKFSIDSTATLAATSPAACPPIPSATMKRRKSSALRKRSSFMWRTGPFSLKPNALTGVCVRSLSCELGSGYYFGSKSGARCTRNLARNWPELRTASRQLAGQLRPRIDADLLDNPRQVLLRRRRRDAQRLGDVAVPIAAQHEFDDLDLTPREPVAVLEGGHVGANLADADRDIPLAARKLHQVDHEGLVVLPGQRDDGPDLLRPVAKLHQLVEQHDEELNPVLAPQPVDQTSRRRIGVDETLAAEDEDRERELIEHRSQNGRR